MKDLYKKFLNIFFILSFVLTGISPACAFISGKTGYIYICAADGSLKQIQVSEEMDIYVLYKAMSRDQTKEKGNPPSQHTKIKDCMFCFFNTGFAKDSALAPVIQNQVMSQFLSISSGTIVLKSASIFHYESRGPPLFV